MAGEAGRGLRRLSVLGFVHEPEAQRFTRQEPGPRPVPNLSLMATRASAGGWTVCELRLIGRVRGFWHGRVVGCSGFLPGRLTGLLCSPRRPTASRPRAPRAARDRVAAGRGPRTLAWAGRGVDAPLRRPLHPSLSGLGLSSLSPDASPPSRLGIRGGALFWCSNGPALESGGGHMGDVG